MTWHIIGDAAGQPVYGRIDDDGLMRVTAIAGYAELDEWLAEGNEPTIVEH
jgi:hypothetical protein